MKLGFIVPGGFDRGDRVIPALHSLTAELGRRHQVVVFAEEGPSGPGEYTRAGAEVHQLDGSAELSLGLRVPGIVRSAPRLGRFAWRLIRHVERARSRGAFSVLHAFWAGHTGLLAGLLGRRLRVPVVLSVGGGEAVWLPAIRYGGAGSPLGRARTRAALRLARAITAGSVFAAEHLPGDAPARARIIPLGIDCDTFAAGAPPPPGPPWRLLQVADLNLVKDQDLLLRAFARVASRLGDVWLDCIGEDTRAGHLQRLAAELGVGDRVRFHGFLPQRQLPDFYRRAHLHLVSSRYESQGVAILEAAAAGVPTVGTPVGLLPMMAPAAARCVPADDAEGFADAVGALLLDDGARVAMGAAARGWSRDHDALWTARSFEAIYESLV